ncbi:unnamed protein product [Protopolystoma xenopodis]|uniref:Uncharacterized protein n=1 Tax=Protopolystoma xenopodis TaxID=117903 RepID=A0A3S5AFD7_9PLAT|nr:unnamed protein product [Protopolystoma xenopodis]
MFVSGSLTPAFSEVGLQEDDLISLPPESPQDDPA